MPRLFICLAFGQLLLMAATAAIGFVKSPQSADVHVLTGTASLLTGCLIQVVVFTYLTVSGKMIAQAVHLGPLSADRLAAAKSLKKSMTRLMAAAVTGLVVLAITGGVHWRTRAWDGWHMAAGAVAFMLQVYAYFRQFGVVVANGQLLDAVLREYSAIPRAHPIKLSQLTAPGEAAMPRIGNGV